VMDIRGLVKEIPQLTFAYVRGHNGNPGNELADSLAQRAAETQKGNEQAGEKSSSTSLHSIASLQRTA
jgi:ribonuclease HI